MQMPIDVLLDNAQKEGRALERATTAEDVLKVFRNLQELLELHSKELRPGEDSLERQLRMVREAVERWPAHMRALAGLDQRRAEGTAKTTY